MTGLVGVALLVAFGWKAEQVRVCTTCGSLREASTWGLGLRQGINSGLWGSEEVRLSQVQKDFFPLRLHYHDWRPLSVRLLDLHRGGIAMHSRYPCNEFVARYNVEPSFRASVRARLESGALSAKDVPGMCRAPAVPGKDAATEAVLRRARSLLETDGR